MEPAATVPLESGMCAVASRPRSRSLSRIPGARKKPIPGFIQFCDPIQRDNPPEGDGWLYEIKADGYRAQVHLRPDQTAVYSRTGLDWSEEFSPIAGAAERLKARSAVLDGEAVVYGSNGLPDFQQLRRDLGRRNGSPLHYHAFDLLYLDGYDLRSVPFGERKEPLRHLLTDAPKTFIFVKHVEANGDEIFRNACRMGLEGLVAKRADAPYRSGRQDS